MLVTVRNIFDEAVKLLITSQLLSSFFIFNIPSDEMGCMLLCTQVHWSLSPGQTVGPLFELQGELVTFLWNTVLTAQND